MTCASNCMLTSFLTVAWLRYGCSSERLGGVFAFIPPTPPTYQLHPTDVDERGSVEAGGGDSGEEETVGLKSSLAARDKPAQSISPVSMSVNIKLDDLGFDSAVIRALSSTQVTSVCNVRGDKLATFMIWAECSDGVKREDQLTILFSHGNATDCLMMLPFLYEVSRCLSVNAFIYEYAGYGGSSGKPTISGTLADIDAAFAYLTQYLGIEKRKIVVYGQSIGSGPSCHLASQHHLCGMVLHSPIASGIRVLAGDSGFCAPARTLKPCDIYVNLDSLDSISCPTFILHGKEDEEVHWTHGLMLHSRLCDSSQYPPWWAEGLGHNDIVELAPAQYFTRLRNFLQYCTDRRGAASSLSSPPMISMG